MGEDTWRIKVTIRSTDGEIGVWFLKEIYDLDAEHLTYNVWLHEKDIEVENIIAEFKSHSWVLDEKEEYEVMFQRF